MTKTAAVRSILRRRALTKAADAYSDLMNGYANAHRGFTRAGVRIAVNDNLRKAGYPPSAARPAPAPAAQAATVRPAPAAQASRLPTQATTARPVPAAQAVTVRPAQATSGALSWIRNKFSR